MRIISKEKMMKKLLLVAAIASFTNLAQAQLWLNGTSYTQNFNGLSKTDKVLPAGWSISFNPSATSVGQDVVGTKYDPSGRSWKSVNNGFRNVASANGNAYFATIGNDSTAQAIQPDRALGVRQISSVGDTTTAFILKIGTTTGLTGFNMNFKLQSLDSTSPRTTTWRVDYGVGANPTSFTAATATGTLTTGGNKYSNNAVAVNFGTGLDNNPGPVWVRIVTLTPTTGMGNRATTAIDDVNLTWTGNATATAVGTIAGQKNLPLFIAGPAHTNGFTLGYEVKKADKYQVTVFDIAGRKVFSREIMAQPGSHQLTISDVQLNAGMYIVKMSNNDSYGTVKVTIE